MNFITTTYSDYENCLPQVGQHILAQQKNDHILVYQAYKHSIAEYALKHQKFGGSDYSYNRMSWIKPNFLWMMYRSGWASKQGQERILGIWLKQTDFEKILSSSEFTSFSQSNFNSEEEWRSSLDSNPIRLQWDPDHLPNGDKHTRKAIQLGIKGELLEEFGQNMPVEIFDLTDFVKSQKPQSIKAPYNNLMVAKEITYEPSSEELSRKVGLTL